MAADRPVQCDMPSRKIPPSGLRVWPISFPVLNSNYKKVVPTLLCRRNSLSVLQKRSTFWQNIYSRCLFPNKTKVIKLVMSKPLTIRTKLKFFFVSTAKKTCRFTYAQFQVIKNLCMNFLWSVRDTQVSAVEAWNRLRTWCVDCQVQRRATKRQQMHSSQIQAVIKTKWALTRSLLKKNTTMDTKHQTTS